VEGVEAPHGREAGGVVAFLREAPAVATMMPNFRPLLMVEEAVGVARGEAGRPADGMMMRLRSRVEAATTAGEMYQRGLGPPEILLERCTFSCYVEEGFGKSVRSLLRSPFLFH